MNQTLSEVTADQLTAGQAFILSYWRHNKVISNWVEFVEADLYYVYFRKSIKIAPNRDPEAISKMALKNIRTLFIED